MARINVEDNIELRIEYRRLLKLVGGDDDRALGMLVRFWRVAQRHWGQHSLVPIEEFNEWGFQPLIESKWAIIKETGVYAIGAEEQFAWYRQKCDAAKKGGRPTGNTTNEVSDSSPVNETKPEQSSENRSIDSVNPLALAPSPALVPVNKKNKESIGSANATPPAVASGKSPPKGRWTEEIREKAQEFAASYVRAYQTRFPNSRPEDLNDGKTRGQILTFVASYPIDRACELIQAYFQMETKWFGTKGYNFETFRNNLNKIGQALDSGKDPDGNEINWQEVKLS